MQAPGFPVPSILRVGADPTFATVVAQAAWLVSPQATVVDHPDLSAALAGEPTAAPQLLALCDPEPAALVRARTATDADGLPRWAVVVFGTVASFPGAEPPLVRAEWHAAQVAHAFWSALAQHRLRRENAQLRGEVAAFGVRVSHDLRTPLGAVLTTAEMVREVLADHSPRDAALLQPVIDSAGELSRLIERVSLLAKTIAAREPPRPLDMGTAFWDAYQQIESQLFKTGASLTQPSTWPTVTGRPAALETVWRNLLANAIQHGGRSVKIEAGWERAGGDLRFWLRDSGSVAPEKRPLLFFPFHRLHEPGAPRGLGLPIVRRLVELHGGRCGYEASSSAGGSIFYFTISVPESA